MGFEDSEYWLTGSPDAIIIRPTQNKPHPVEIKTKDHDVVEKMQNGKKSYDEPHRRQALTYIGLTHDNSEQFPDLDICTSGSLLYVSRNRPHFTHEFKFQYSASFMEQGRAKLSEWKESFLEGILPLRPNDWKWTEQPCRFCNFKKACKQDVKDKITELSKSNTIKFAKEIRPEYDYDQMRFEVLNRWNPETEINVFC
jgi:hypothetical protein